MPKTRKAQERLRTRKSFNQSIPFERMVVEGNRLRNLHQKAICLDVSESGLGLSADSTLQKGEVLKLFLPIQKVHIYLPVFAEVVWANPSNGHFRIGLRILQ